jgi:hypothetical protein
MRPFPGQIGNKEKGSLDEEQWNEIFGEATEFLHIISSW